MFVVHLGIFDTKNPELCDPDMRILNFLQDNYEFMQSESEKHFKTSEYWLAVKGMLAQLDGVLAGFIDGQHGSAAQSNNLRKLEEKHNNEDKEQQLADLELTSMNEPSIMHFLILNGNGDMFTLIEKFAQIDTEKNITFLGVDCSRTEQRNKNRKLSENFEQDFIYDFGTSVVQRKRAKLTGKGKDAHRTDHCSALVKILPDGSDVVFGHNTWDDYRNMGPRIFKHYIYPRWPFLANDEKSKCSPETKVCVEHCSARKAHSPPHTYFSSSPGWLTSVDDFYTTFTSPIPSEVEGPGGCSCICDEGNMGENGDVDLLKSSESIESAVKDNILEASSPSVTDDIEKSSVNQNSGRMAIIETSLDIYDSKLYDLVVPSTMLSWARARTANTLAQSGADWAARFAKDHSGTYPNQWIIVDFEKFDKSSNGKGQLLPGFLTIVEEMPGKMISRDETDHLRKKTYWASYNLPFYEEISVYSKNSQLCQTQRNIYIYQNETIPGVNVGENTKEENSLLGNGNCYGLCSRAKLFERLHSKVVDIPSALKVLSHNEYKTDKEASGNPCEEIACRDDLQPLDENMNVFGAIDTKLSSVIEADTMYHEVPGYKFGEDLSLSASSYHPPIVHLAPQPLVFPLPIVVPSIVDVSTSGDAKPVLMQSFGPNDKKLHHKLFKVPRIFARQGPTHDGSNKPFCWLNFEARHDAWVAKVKGTPNTGSRALRAEEHGWRKRKPAFK